MEKRLTTALITVFGVIVGLTLLGYFLPGSLNWGFHFLGFLPMPFLLLYLCAAAGIYLLVQSGKMEQYVYRWALTAGNGSRRFLALSGIVFIILAFVFRVGAPMVTDVNAVISNLRSYADGTAPFAPGQSPLLMRFYFLALTITGTLQSPSASTLFFIIGVLSGLGTLLVSFLISRELFESPVARLLLFLLLMVLPCTEAYFGIIGVNAIQQFLLALFVLVSLRFLNGKLSFVVLPLLFVVLLFAQYSGVVLIIPLAYSAYRQVKQGGLARVIMGSGAALLLAIGILAMFRFEWTALVSPVPFSRFLPLSPEQAPAELYSTPYTLFSFYHVVDFINLLLFIAPFAFVIVLFFAAEEKEFVVNGSPVQWWLALAAIPAIVLFFILKWEQGLAAEWGVPGGYAMLANCFAAVLFFRVEDSHRVRLFAMVVAVTLLQSLTWFTVNALREPAVHRIEICSDRRVVSHLGDYSRTLALFRDFAGEADSAALTGVWGRYIGRHPEDPRGYAGHITILKALAPGDFTSTAQAYERWLTIDPANDSLRREYASYCTDAGTYYFRAGQVDTAGFYFQRSVIFDSTSAKAYNNLGSVLAQKGLLEQAQSLFLHAVRLDSLYGDAFYNLALISNDRGDRVAGGKYLRRAAELGNNRARVQLGASANH
jgi:hypothetical protein